MEMEILVLGADLRPMAAAMADLGHKPTVFQIETFISSGGFIDAKYDAVVVLVPPNLMDEVVIRELGRMLATMMREVSGKSLPRLAFVLPPGASSYDSPWAIASNKADVLAAVIRDLGAEVVISSGDTDADARAALENHGKERHFGLFGGTALILAWHPDVITPEEYAELVAAIGDLARAEGAAGIQRIFSETVGVTVEVGVLT